MVSDRNPDMRSVSASDVHAWIEESLLMDPGTLAADSRLGDLDGWDSLAHVSFLELAREHGGLALSVEDLRTCATARDLALAVCRRAERRRQP
jgi:acyl carrier protein